MSDSLLFLRRNIALIERTGGLVAAGVASRAGNGTIATGHAGIDRALGGGLMRGRLHELLADGDMATGQANSGGNAPCAAGFATVLARRLGGAVLWLREAAAEGRAGRLHPVGLAELGLDPGGLVLAALPDAAAVLQAAVDALRCPALGVVVIELAGNPRVLDLTAGRRLALAAAGSGVTALLLRPGGAAGPGAAQTRWRVAAAPSHGLAGQAPGHAAWDIILLRQRGRPDGGQWRVEWNRDEGQLRDWHDKRGEDSRAAALSGAVVPIFADRPAGARAALRRAG